MGGDTGGRGSPVQDMGELLWGRGVGHGGGDSLFQEIWEFLGNWELFWV